MHKWASGGPTFPLPRAPNLETGVQTLMRVHLIPTGGPGPPPGCLHRGDPFQYGAPGQFPSLMDGIGHFLSLLPGLRRRTPPWSHCSGRSSGSLRTSREDSTSEVIWSISVSLEKASFDYPQSSGGPAWAATQNPERRRAGQ